MEDSSNSGKRILLTGGTSGLGLEIARVLLSKDYEIYATGRNNINIDHQIRGFHFVKVDFCDLENLASVMKNLSEMPGGFDIIINNAGVLSPPEFTASSNSIEYTFQVNFLAHLLINEIMLEKRLPDTKCRIIPVTSPVYRIVKPGFRIPERNGYHPFKTYSESKHYMLYLADIHRKNHPGNNITCSCFDPGIFRSGIYRTQKKWFHLLYKAGAPFLRHPGKVAYGLAGMLMEEDLQHGAIYRTGGKYTFHKAADAQRAGEFMQECLELIKPYLPASRV